MRRVPLIAFKRNVNYPLYTSLFDDNNPNAIHTSSDDGGDEGKTPKLQRTPTRDRIPFRKVYANLRQLTEVLAAESEKPGKKLTRYGAEESTESFDSNF